MSEIERIRSALDAPGAASSDFDLNPDTVLPDGRKLRPAAVLVPLIQRDNGLQVVLTKRSSRLKHHPGQIAFPGGKVDDGDANVTDAALREAWEEIGLPRDLVSPIGTLPTHETVTSFTVHPIVAEIQGSFSPVPETGEVEEVFEVPLSHVSDPVHFSIQYRMWQGRKRRYYTVPFGPYYIWGATARILRGLADRLA